MFFCTLPDCDYKVAVKLALGKRCICNRCDKPFILNEYSIRLVKPHCDECHKSKDGKLAIKTSEFLSKPMTLDEIIEDQLTEGHRSSSSSLLEKLARATHKPVESDEEI